MMLRDSLSKSFVDSLKALEEPPLQCFPHPSISALRSPNTSASLHIRGDKLPGAPRGVEGPLDDVGEVKR